jgi:uncharacterized RDD family membrane protein YckC
MEVTYKIIGGDGAEYGPVGLEELKRWVLDGRVGVATQVWRSDVSRWAPASGYSELERELGQVSDLLAESAHGQARPVGFWARLGAYLIDIMVLQGTFIAIWGTPPATPVTPGGFPDFEAMVRELTPRLSYQMLIIISYNVLMNGWFGATLGKFAIGARIVNLDGSAIGFGKALLRWLAMIATNITLGIGFLIVAFRADKRALHDLIARTRVVSRYPQRTFQDG